MPRTACTRCSQAGCLGQRHVPTPERHGPALWARATGVVTACLVLPLMVLGAPTLLLLAALLIIWPWN